MKIESFQNEYRFLSNFWPCKINFEGLEYPSTECAYQAAKTTIGHLRVPFTTMTAGQSKRAGKSLSIRPDWNDVKVQIMLELLRCKFNQFHLKQLLLSTGDSELIEGNTWGDTFWGICNGKGLNNLGKLLMQVRKELQ